VRDIGLDVHRDFCEVAIVEASETRSAGRIEATPEALELFAQSLGRDDRVALEVTGNAWEIARIIEPHVARVLVVSPPTPGSARRARRPTGSTRARSRSCRGLARGAPSVLTAPRSRSSRSAETPRIEIARAIRSSVYAVMNAPAAAGACGIGAVAATPIAVPAYSASAWSRRLNWTSLPETSASRSLS
jgi:transposase